MKRILTILVCLLAIQFSAQASKDKRITFDQLPAQSQQLIKKHFDKQPIALVKMESELFDKSYEVIFTNGDKIEFDKKGEWKEVDCKYTQLPVELIPVQIQNHVSKNYPDIKVIKIEKESRNRYEISLANDIDLEFDSKFNLIDIDN
ncbi:MAG: PepSY-like domain-containing protein [Prevotella sp.]|jgi:hypothetical protein|nr:PepSY-like domain-containing protein [Prevotella sp.]